MKMKLFTCIIFCGLVFQPAVIVNSQTHDNTEKIKKLNEKEAENRILKVKIKVNEQEINDLLGQLIETKTEVKRKPIYKRIFTHRSKKRALTKIMTDPVPVNNIDTELVTVYVIDSLAPIVPTVQKRDNFFKRIFKIFNHKK